MASKRPGPGELLGFVWRHPANRGRRGAAVVRAVAWQLEKRVLRRDTELRLPGGAVLAVPRDSTSASQALYTAGLPDYHEMRFMLRLLEAGDAVVDVGANVGVWTLMAASVVRPGRVLAIEPGARARARLVENLRRNDLLRDVEVCGEVVAERGGLEVGFLRERDTTNRIVTEAEAGAAAGALERRRTVTLDALWGDEEAPRLVKVDVEGAEPRVLEGASRMLAAARPPVWVVEWSRQMARHGRSPWDLFRWLRARGWLVARYDADRNELVVFERWSQALEPGVAPRNVLLVAERALEALRERLRRSGLAS